MSWFVRGLVGLAALALAVFVGFQMFKSQIAWFVFDQAVGQNAGIDHSAKLPDGLHIYLCGTGSPMPDATRAGPCIGVLAGERAYVFDVGSGGMRKLGAMGFPIDRLEGVYLTHLHSDHIDGLGELMVLAWVGGHRSEPLPIAGPVGTAQVVAGFNTAYQLDSTYRIAHHGADIVIPSGFGGQAHEINVPMGLPGTAIAFEDDQLTITAINVVHSPIEPAFGYRIDYKDRSISISGDTIFHPGFVASSHGVDVMLHEALDPEMVSKIGGVLAERAQDNNAQIFEDILDYHTYPEDAARAAQQARVSHLVLYHLVPALPTRFLNDIFLGDARREFDGRITVGEDGLMISLPAGSQAILQSQAL